MSRSTIFVCVAVATVLTLAVGGVVAQQDDDDGPGIEVDETTIDENETAVLEVDSTTRLMGWEYDDEREGFVLRFDSDDSQRITITEAVQFNEGAGSGRIYSQRIPPGASEIFVYVPRRGGQAAVTMVTSESQENNRFTYVSTGQTSPDRPPIPYETAQLLVLLSGAGAAGATFYVVRRKREDETNEVERIL